MKNIPHLAESFGITLKTFRERSKLSQVALAEKIGSVDSYIRLLEHGKNAPTLTTFHLLCEALQVNPHEFMDTYQSIITSKTGE